MSTSVRIGRIAGIEVGVNWSWFFVFWLIVWSLAEGVFPSQNPGLSTGTYWAMGVVAGLLYFGSILLHELGHAVQARRDGVEIDGITLWLFGGVARLRGTYRTPGVEFRITIAGPLVTAVLVVLLLGLAALTDLPAAVDGVIAWLGYINLVLLGFNLIPALPLDGGRLLHAALWRARNDLTWATRVCVTVGQSFGVLFVTFGFLLAFAGALLAGVWLAFVGWFIAGAAAAEGFSLGVGQALEGLRVADVMSRAPVVVPADMTVGQLMDDVVPHTALTSYPVVDGGRPGGLVDLACIAQLPRSEWDARRIRECMRTGIPMLSPDEDATVALEAVAGPPRRAFVVDEDQRLVGVVSQGDLLRAVESRGRGGRRGAGQPGHTGSTVSGSSEPGVSRVRVPS